MNRAGYQPIAWRFGLREPLQSCAADRAIELIRLALSSVKLGPLIQRAAGAQYLGSCHSGQTRRAA
jgi:hypothetical protein